MFSPELNSWKHLNAPGKLIYAGTEHSARRGYGSPEAGRFAKTGIGLVVAIAYQDVTESGVVHVRHSQNIRDVEEIKDLGYKWPTRQLLRDRSVLASILVLVGTFNTIISYFVFVVVIFLGLTVAALFVLRRKANAGISYRTPGYPLTPIIFLLLIALLLFLLGGHNPKQASLGVGIVALGLPFYYLFFRGPRGL